MRYDEVYEYVGDIGTFQVCVFIYINMFMLFMCDNIAFIFVGGVMPHWCKVPELAAFSYERQKYIAIPSAAAAAAGGGDDGEYSQCEMYAFNYSAFSDAELVAWNRSVMVTNSTAIAECSDWVYEQTTFVSTVVSRVSRVSLFYVDS